MFFQLSNPPDVDPFWSEIYGKLLHLKVCKWELNQFCWLHRFHNWIIDVRAEASKRVIVFSWLHQDSGGVHESFDCIVVPLRSDHGHFEFVSVEVQSTHTWNPISVCCYVKCIEINFLAQLTVCGLRWLSRKCFAGNALLFVTLLAIRIRIRCAHNPSELVSNCRIRNNRQYFTSV